MAQGHSTDLACGVCFTLEPARRWSGPAAKSLPHALHGTVLQGEASASFSNLQTEHRQEIDLRVGLVAVAVLAGVLYVSLPIFAPLGGGDLDDGDDDDDVLVAMPFVVVVVALLAGVLYEFWLVFASVGGGALATDDDLLPFFVADEIG